MPFPFVLPTTSAFSFSASVSSESHPSLALTASTYRGIARDALKKHKRLPPSSQASNAASVISSLSGYIPYLLAVDAALRNELVAGTSVSAMLTSPPTIEWRPTLSDNIVPGREISRVKVQSLEYEIAFILSTLANSYVAIARAVLHPLYSTSTASVGTVERTTAITTATRYLLDASSVYDYLANRSEHINPSTKPPCADVAPPTVRAMSELNHAEATLLAVLKDDPYPAAVAQDRNEHDREWMYKAPDIPKVRAHLFARLCLAAAEHASRASSLCQAVSGRGIGKIDESLLRYLEDLRRTSRAKACRFFGIDSELGGQTGTAIAWLNAGLQELGVEVKDSKKASGLSRLKKEWTEKREDKRVEKEAGWGADAGRLEEIRILEMLGAKWNKINDTIGTQLIPPTGPLLSQMPSGREIHTIKPFRPPELERAVLESMRVVPEQTDDLGNEASSDEEGKGATPVGAYPGTSTDYGGRGAYY